MYQISTRFWNSTNVNFVIDVIQLLANNATRMIDSCRKQLPLQICSGTHSRYSRFALSSS